MTFVEWLRTLFGRPQSTPRASTPTPRATRAFSGGGRATVDNSGSALLGWGPVVLPPADYESHWRAYHLDSETLRRESPTKLMEILSDLSPEVSRAVYDFQRLFNPGWTVKAFQLGSEDAEDARAQAAIDVFIDQLRSLYGTVDIVFGRLSISAFSRGALFAEIVLDGRGRLPIDLVVPDPASVRFQQRSDPERGAVWQLGQWQGGQFVELTSPTVRYVPIDPFMGSPYGRPLAAPALFTSLFLLSVMHDLKRVIMQQGYPRLDIAIDEEKILVAMRQLGEQPENYMSFMQDVVNQVKDVYDGLRPDDAYIHMSSIAVNKPVGTIGADAIGGINSIIVALERMATRALKSMPLLQGIQDSTSETQANRQYEVFAAGIKSIQHYAESLLEHLLTVGLQAQGIQARVEFRFAELRAAEELRDAQTDAMKTANARAKYEAGYISQDEAANDVVGHDADAPEPRVSAGAPTLQQDNNDGNEALNQGSDRGVQTRAQRVKIIPDGASEPLPPVPQEVELSDTDIEQAIAEWDYLMPEFAGLLDATGGGGAAAGADRQFPGPLDWEDKPPFGVATYVYRRVSGDASPWVWSQESKRYRNTADGRFIGQRKMTELRDQFIEAKRGNGANLARELANGTMTVQEFELGFRWEIKSTFVDQYVLGKGGRNAMTQADFGTVGAMIKSQYAYAHRFAQDIAAGKLSQAQIAQRAGLYIDSSTQAFERGKTASYGMPSLPDYPASGNQICKSNCKCSWSIAETDEEWRCTWLTSSGESCDTCIENAAKWAPLIIAKGGRSRADVERALEGMANGFH